MNLNNLFESGTQQNFDIAEGPGRQLTVQQLATISDAALDQAYGYGRSTPGNSFGWQANLMSAAYAKKLIDAGVTDIEKISDAIHKGWNVTAQKFVQNPEQFDDTEKLRQAGKLDAKLQQRAKLMKINYAQLDNEEQEKDRVVARALLQAIKGQQGVAEATGDEKFDNMMGQMQREPKYPDPQMPPTDVKDLYQWAVKNNKPYHKIFAEWANREGYKSVAPALQRAGDLDTEALDYWTPRVWEIYWGEVRGIDSEMPPEWAKKRIPDELRDYLDTVFDAYDRIVFDWPTEYRQIGQQGVAEGVNDYLWHGSKSEHGILYPQQANDTGGKEESNKNAVYATPSAKVAIAMGLTTPDSDTGMFPNDPQMIMFSGKIRKGQMVYLHKVPKNLFIKHNDREWYSKPGVKEVKPLEIKAVPVDQWLHLIRQATPQDLELRKKHMKKQGVAESVEFMSDAQFYGEILSVLAAMGAGLATGAYLKARDIVKMYNADRIMRALEGYRVGNISDSERQALTKLIAEFKQAMAQRQGEQALAIANRIKSIATDRTSVAEGSVAKKPQPYHDLDWLKKLPKEKLDAMYGKKHKTPQPDADKKSKPQVSENREIKKQIITHILKESRL